MLDAELRSSPTSESLPGGVATAIQAAADINDMARLIKPTHGGRSRAFPLEDTPVQEQEDALPPGADTVPRPAKGACNKSSMTTSVADVAGQPFQSVPICH